MAVRMVEDSRHVRPGDVFLARPGEGVDGRDFIDAAEAAGAVATLSDEEGCERTSGPALFSRRLVQDGAILAHRLAGRPSHCLDLVGVTGTNGKTTVTTLLHHLLLGRGPSALLGGVVIDTGRVRSQATLTTPMASDVSNWLASAVQAGCRTATMEVSSHALCQGRVEGIRFRSAIFTGLSGDHLDYHGSMEAYEACKRSLLEGLDRDASAIVNLDDHAGSRMSASARGRVIGCSLHGLGEVRGEIARMTAEDTVMEVNSPWGSWRQRVPLPGRHNAMNALQAIAAALDLGGSPSEAQDRMETASGPPGRLQCVSTEPRVLVDFAHTDGALHAVLESLRGLASPEQRILLVIGCGGDRDHTKRPRMAAVAAEGAHEVWLTSDNPRSEDPAAILRDMAAGIPAGHSDHIHMEVDRAAAITLAVAAAREKDIVLIAGKGHEKYQLIGDQLIPFDDVEIAAAAVAMRGAPA